MDAPFITVDPWTPGEKVAFSGLGVTLRSMTPEDVDETLLARLRDPRVSSQLAIGGNVGAITRPAVLKWLAQFGNRRSFFLAIRPQGGSNLLGFCTARTDAHMVSVLTLAITDVNRWGHNAGPAAARLLRYFLFDTVKVHKLVSRIYGTNTIVIKGLEDYGWVREGVLREAESVPGGGRRDIVLLAMLRAEHLVHVKPIDSYVP